MTMLKSFGFSLAMGLLVGVIYSIISLRSPAPPVAALAGLFGMLVGEQLVPLVQRLRRGEPLTLAWFRHECVPKISGTPPPVEGPRS